MAQFHGFSCDRCGLKAIHPELPRGWAVVSAEGPGVGPYRWELCSGCLDEVRGLVMGSSSMADLTRKRCGQPGCPHDAEPGLSLCEGCWDLANEAAGDRAGARDPVELAHRVSTRLGGG